MFRFAQNVANESTTPVIDASSLVSTARLPALREDGCYAGLATFPRRSENCRLLLRTIQHQFDHIFIYFNGYTTAPEWAQAKNVTSFVSADFVDLNATGKVFFSEFIDKGFYFTLDDDLFYPANYAVEMVNAMKRYNYRVAACVHGSIFPPIPKYYYLRTAAYTYQGALSSDKFVCLPGTGSFACKADTLNLSLRQFLPLVMVDLTCAIMCKSAGIPLVCVARPRGWLQNTDREGLYQQFTRDKMHHTDYALQYGPWSFDEYRIPISNLIEKVEVESGVSADDVRDWDAIFSATNGTIPRNWIESPEYFIRLAEHRRSQIQSFSV